MRTDARMSVCLGGAGEREVASGCWDRRDDRRRLRLGVCFRCLLEPLLGRDGWPSRDRAVDAPALQDVPSWDGIVAWLSRWVTLGTRWSLEKRALQSAFDAVASDAEGGGSDSLWPIQSAKSHLEIRRVLEALLKRRCGRSSVVFTEGADSSPQDWGKCS